MTTHKLGYLGFLGLLGFLGFLLSNPVLYVLFGLLVLFGFFAIPEKTEETEIQTKHISIF